jgi:hypothetical protein
MCSSLDAAAGVEQDLFVRDLDLHAEIVLRTQILGDQIREVMSIDDDFVNAEVAEAHECELKHGSAGNFNQCLGAIVGEGTESRAQAGGQYHRPHLAIFSGKFFSSSM